MPEAKLERMDVKVDLLSIYVSLMSLHIVLENLPSVEMVVLWMAIYFTVSLFSFIPFIGVAAGWAILYINSWMFQPWTITSVAMLAYLAAISTLGTIGFIVYKTRPVTT